MTRDELDRLIIALNDQPILRARAAGLSQEDAEDATHNAIERAYNHLRRHPANGSVNHPTAWFSRILDNEIANIQRANARRTTFTRHVAANAEPVQATPLLTSLEPLQLLEAHRRLLKQPRLLIILANRILFPDLTLDELAKELDTTKHALSSSLYQARRLLRRIP